MAEGEKKIQEQKIATIDQIVVKYSDWFEDIKENGKKSDSI